MERKIINVKITIKSSNAVRKYMTNNNDTKVKSNYNIKFLNINLQETSASLRWQFSACFDQQFVVNIFVCIF